MISNHREWTSRAGLLAVLMLTVPFAGTATGQERPAEGKAVSVETADGWSVPMTYWESPMGKNAPVVVLLHGLGQNRTIWKAAGLVDQLVKEQYAVVTVDLRKHGDSKIPENAPARLKNPKPGRFDFEAMIAMDLEAVKKFLYDEHQAQRLNMRKLGLVGTDMSTVLAINYAALDWAKTPYDDAPTLAARTPRGQDVQALVLLSPEESLSGVSTLRSIPVLRQAGVAMLILYGSKKAGDKKTAERLFQQSGGEQQDEASQRIYRQDFDAAQSGTELLLRQPQARVLILAFLKKHVFDPQIEWRDRRSRLN